MTSVREEKTHVATVKVGAGQSARRRGRPYRLPSDPTPISEPVPGLSHRLAWLLGSSRIYASDPQLARRAIFIRALQDVGATADSTKLSRWESGRAPVPISIVHAYEEVLGLPKGQLTVGASALVCGAERIHHPVETPQANPTQAHLQLDDLFAKVLAGRAPGHVWLELCDHLTRQEHLYLLPDTWQQISDLLSSELSCSSGLAYFSRFEALRILVAYPSSRRHAIRAIGSVATNPALTFMIHPLVLLQEIDDEQAWELLARLLQGAASTLRGGAAWAVAGKVTRGDVGEPELKRVESIVLGMLQESRSAVEQLDALTMVRALPPESLARLDLHNLDDDVRTLLDLALRNAEIRDAHRARSISSKIAETAQLNTSIDYVVGDDLMLHRLVREALFHVDHARRSQAALLLAASPYRAQLGDPLMSLAGRDDECDAVIATSALFHVADQQQRQALLDVGLTDPRASVCTTSLMTLGQVVGEVTPDEGELLRPILAQPGPATLKAAALHVLGMGSAKLLNELALNGPHADAARWWLDRRSIVETMARV